MAASGGERYLAHGETSILEVRRHYSILLGPFLLTLLVLVVVSALGFVLTPGRSDHPVDTTLGLVAVFFALRFLWKAVVWWADRLVVTDQRLFEVSGILTRKIASMPLEKVTDMTYRRTIAGRILGFGDLIIESPGQKQALEVIGHIPRPDDFYRTVTTLVTSHETSQPLFRSTLAFDQEDTGPIPRVIV